jgi:hypothetical protein
MRTVALAVVVVLGLGLSAHAAGADTSSGTGARPEPFRSAILPIDAALAKRMTGVSWRPGCPVALRDLRLLVLTHWGFDGRAKRGSLVVHRDAARELVSVFRRL